jgi:hypothetical protein
MPPHDFRSRFRAARLIPVLLFYLALCWSILLLVNLLQEKLGLPAWMDPVAIVLLLVGLVIISATAWALSHPLTRERRAAGKVPGNWEVAPKALVGDLVVGRVPHLTWGRSVLGGMFVLGLMFALAAFVAFLAGVTETEDPGALPAAEEPHSDPASPGPRSHQEIPDADPDRDPRAPLGDPSPPSP